MAFAVNSIMYWNDGVTFQRITDHNRQPLSVSWERIENGSRMVDGTYRRSVVTKKRTWTTSWEMLPSTNAAASPGMQTADAGWAGDSIENFHNSTDGSFQMQLREGDGTLETVNVIITDFSKEVAKRGPRVDFWNLSITLTEV